MHRNLPSLHVSSLSQLEQNEVGFRSYISLSGIFLDKNHFSDNEEVRSDEKTDNVIGSEFLPPC